MTVLIGSDGNVTMPTGYKGAIQTWSASFTRPTSIVTAFGNAGQKRIASKVLDITGSAAGIVQYATGTTNGLSGIIADGAAEQVKLSWHDAGSTECSVNIDCVFTQVDVGAAVDGDSTIAFNFEIAGTSNLAFIWDEV